MTYRIMVFRVEADGSFDVPDGLELKQVMEITGNVNKQVKAIVKVT